MTVLILHGIDGHAGIHWQEWLHNELEILGHKVIMPTLPDAHHPKRSTWLSTIEQIVAHVPTSELVLVGHSLGVASALDFVEGSPTPIKGLVSVSGFATNYGAVLNAYFMAERSIDFTKVNKKLENAFVFYGSNDPYVPQTELANLAMQLSVSPTIIPNGGHLNADAGFTTFPELLSTITAI